MKNSYFRIVIWHMRMTFWSLSNVIRRNSIWFFSTMNTIKIKCNRINQLINHMRANKLDDGEKECRKRQKKNWKFNTVNVFLHSIKRLQTTEKSRWKIEPRWSPLALNHIFTSRETFEVILKLVLIRTKLALSYTVRISYGGPYEQQRRKIKSNQMCKRLQFFSYSVCCFLFFFYFFKLLLLLL